MTKSRLSRPLYILAVMALLIGVVLHFRTGGGQFWGALIVAIVLAGLGLIVGGRRNG